MEKETTDKEIQKIKEILEKDHGREFTWEEATKASWDIKRLAQVGLKIIKEQLRREKLLKQSPKGFHLDGMGSCLICGSSASNENSWYDKYGLKCMLCQKAINDKIIPGSIAKNKESWYSKYDLEQYFNIKGTDLNRYIKQSFLKQRLVPSEKKKVHFQIFLLKDNKDVLPPKKLLKSRMAKVVRNGEEYYTNENWYEFVDVKLFKRIAKYRIVECFEESFAKPIETGSFLIKEISPLFTLKQ